MRLHAWNLPYYRFRAGYAWNDKPLFRNADEICCQRWDYSFRTRLYTLLVHAISSVLSNTHSRCFSLLWFRRRRLMLFYTSFCLRKHPFLSHFSSRATLLCVREQSINVSLGISQLKAWFRTLGEFRVLQRLVHPLGRPQSDPAIHCFHHQIDTAYAKKAIWKPRDHKTRDIGEIVKD